MKKVGVIITASDLHRAKNMGNRSLIDLDLETAVIDRQIDVVRSKFKNCDVVVVTGFEHKELYDHLQGKCAVVENDLFDITSSVKSICLGLRVLNNKTVVVIPNNIVFSAKIFDSNSGLIITKQGMYEKTDIGLLLDNDLIRWLDYDLDTKWSQIGVFSGDSLARLRFRVERPENHRKLLHEVLNDIINVDQAKIPPIMCRRCSIVQINTHKDIEKARKFHSANPV